MIDGNISMEEDTELRDLVVQTLENNGVLAKLRAELRASVFLALEEQEAVANPEPLLNKTVKQYLADEEGKLLFSLVREFLEYFGLDYTISVYDSETYFGKEYDYPGRNKLSNKLGLGTDEPLLGEILKNGINTAMDDTRKSHVDKSKKTNEANVCDTTFQVSKATEQSNESASLSNDNDEKLESISDASPDLPINVTITDKKKWPNEATSDTVKREDSEIGEDETVANNNVHSSKLTSILEKESLTTSGLEQETGLNVKVTNIMIESEELMNFDDKTAHDDEETNRNEDLKCERIKTDLRITNNAQNTKIVDAENNFEKTVYFDEIIVDGKRQRIAPAVHKSESLLGELPPLVSKSNSIFGDLPPLNGKKTNINDLKELMDIGLGVDGSDNYEEDFISSASVSANENSPTKESDVDSPDRSGEVLSKKKTKKKRDTSHRSARNDEVSEDADEIEEVFSNASCLEDTSGDNGISNFRRGITADCKDAS